MPQDIPTQNLAKAGPLTPAELDAIDRVPSLRAQAAHLQQVIRDKLAEHTRGVTTHGIDMPEIRDWRWPS